MSPRGEQTLSDAFLEDHQHLTGGLSRLIEFVETDDITAAVQMADALDRQAGPHIRFEEEYFYPAVASSRGADYVSRLLHEHDTGRRALRAVLSCGAGGRLEPEEKTRIVAGLREALDHAVSCGTLLSHITTLAPGAQQTYLDRLRQLRDEGGRWTERSSENVADSGSAD